MKAFVVLKIVLVIDLYFYVHDDRKHIVEAKPAKSNGSPFPGTEVDWLPFLHQRARRSVRKLLNQRLSEYDGVLSDAVSPDSHFSRFPEDYFIYRQGPNFEATDATDTDDSIIPPRKPIRRKSKKMTREELAKWETNRKGKKAHKKKLVHRQNSTTAKGQPFDIVVHIKVNES